jgi:membrane protease YdiL (CAAX protease family)
MLLVISGSAGMLLCFWPGRRPVRNILLFVCVPSLWSIAVVCVRILMLAKDPDIPVIVASRGEAHGLVWALECFWALGPGLRFATVGVLSVGFFVYKLATGRSSLPVDLNCASIVEAGDARTWNRIWIFLWFSISIASIVYFVVVFPLTWIYRYLPARLHDDTVAWFHLLITLLSSVAYALIAACVAGSGWWREFREFTRLRRGVYVLVGVAISLTIWALIPFAGYAVDRVKWATAGIGIMPPDALSYFSLPDVWGAANLLAAAFFEEVVFRGYLQGRFLRRYGCYRGLVMLCVFWGACHFVTDFPPGLSDADVLIRLIWRLASCLGMGFVFGWLTLRADSILPAVACHWLSNVAVESNRAYIFNFRIEPLLNASLWCVAAYFLFHYWPPRDVAIPMPIAGPITEEPAV